MRTGPYKLYYPNLWEDQAMTDEALIKARNLVSGFMLPERITDPRLADDLAIAIADLLTAPQALAATPAVAVKASSRIKRAKAIREEQQCSLQEAVRLERAEFLTAEIQSAASIEDLKTILLSIVNYRHSA